MKRVSIPARFVWVRRPWFVVTFSVFLGLIAFLFTVSALSAQPAPRQPGWFSVNRRNIHILYVSPEWAKDRSAEFDAEAYAENLSRAGVKMVELYTKDHHGYVYYKSKTGRQYPRDVLGEMLAACHKRGIKLIAYYSVAFDNYASGIHPEWLRAHKDGQYWEAEFTRWVCMNSPYTDFALEQIRELVTNYDVDGLWLDIMPVTWHHFQETGSGAELDPFCYCIYCRRKYQNTYHRDIPMNPDLQESLDGYHMQVDGAQRFMEKAKALLLQYRPNAVITYNGSGGPEDPLLIGDLISIEGHPPAYYHQDMLVRWARGQIRPMEILSAGALSGWDGWDQKPVNMMRLETAIALAHGCGVTFGQQPYPRGNPEQADFKAFQELFNWVSKMEDYARSPESVSDIGVYLSLKSWDAPQLGVASLGETEGIHTFLLRDQWQYDILKNLSTLNRYKLVIVGDDRAMSNAEADKLRSYVRDGGRLLVTGLTGLYDERGKKRSDFVLADVLGVSYIDTNRYPNYYTDQAPPGLLKGEAFKVEPQAAKTLTYFLNPETIWTKATTVLWQDPPPDPAQRYPLVTVNRFGNGQCIYIAASIGNTIRENVRQAQYLDTYAVKLLREALRTLEIQPSVITTTMGTEVVLNKHKEGYILHLINYMAGPPLWLSDTNRGEVRGVEVAIKKSIIGNPMKAIEIETGKVVPLRQEGEWTKFEAPPYQVSTAILLQGAAIR